MEPAEFQRRFRAHIVVDTAQGQAPEVRLNVMEFTTFDRTILEHYGVHSEDAAFLVEVGLPRQAAPFLDFEPHSAEDLQELYDLRDLPRTLFPLGHNGSGDPLGIELKSRAIVFLNHNDRMRRVFINSSLKQFGASLCLYQEVFHAGKLKEFLQELRLVDEPSVTPGSMWYTEVSTEFQEDDG